MPTKRTPKRLVSQGATGETVRQNVARIRKDAGVTSERLVHLMGDLGYAMPRTAISEIENGGRRVSVDDLMALSIALNVNPSALLLPYYIGDEDYSDEVTAMPEGTTAADIWAWGDGWQALPYHRTDSLEIDEALSGADRGRAEAQRRMGGWEFLGRIRPSSESSQQRSFMAKVATTVKELSQGDWVTLWFHVNASESKAARVVAYPEGGWRDISKYFDRVKAELAGILGSELAAPFIKEVLAKRTSNGDS